MTNLTYKALRQCLYPLMDLSRFFKRTVSILVDIVILFSSWVLVYYLRYDSIELLNDESFVLSFAAVAAATIAIFSLLGLYKFVVRYIGLRSMLAMAAGAIVSGVLLNFAIDANAVLYSLSANLNYVFFAFIGVAGSRLLLRELVMVSSRAAQHRVLIYGAGASGRQLLLALGNSAEFRAVAFVDDDPSFHGVMIRDVKVYSPACIEAVVEKYCISRILLAVPSASRGTRAKLIERLEPLGLPVLTIPGMADLVDGKMKIDGKCEHGRQTVIS